VLAENLVKYIYLYMYGANKQAQHVMHESHQRENEQLAASIRHSCDRPAGSPHAPGAKYTCRLMTGRGIHTSWTAAVYMQAFA
jgi:hypothetical protein